MRRTKRSANKFCSQAHARGDFPLTILRPAFTYGEGRGLVHTFGGSTMYLDRIRKGKPIVVHGDGSSLWTSCHRDDVARAFVALRRTAAYIRQIVQHSGRGVADVEPIP